jgi:hypothetical protein
MMSEPCRGSDVKREELISPRRAHLSFVEPAFRRKGILDQSSKHGITHDKCSMANSQFKPGVTPHGLSGLKIGN